MSTAYNSKLISKLYSDLDQEEIIELIKEMEVIGDPIFLRPLLDSFLKNLKKSYSHYFIITILSFKDKQEVLNIAIEIAESYEKLFHKNDMAYLFEIFSELDYKSDEINNIGLKLLDLGTNGHLDYFDIDIIFEYFQKNNQAILTSDYLLKIVENINIGLDNRIHAFNLWLKSNIEPNFDYLLIADLKDREDKLDIIIASTIINWKGGKVEKLKIKIMNEGSEKAREIIQRNQIKKDKIKQIEIDNKTNEQLSSYNQNNSKLIGEIIHFRKEINILFYGKFKKELFVSHEEIILEINSPINEPELHASCIRLRDFFEKIINFKDLHGLSKEEQNKLLPDCTTLNKPINAFYLFLKSKNINIDGSIFGFRDIHTISSLIGSHSNTEKEKLFKLLEQKQWKDLYLKRDYLALHHSILNSYKEFLQKLLNELKK